VQLERRLLEVPAFSLAKTSNPEDADVFTDFGYSLFREGVAQLPFPEVYVEEDFDVDGRRVSLGTLASMRASDGSIVYQSFALVAEYWTALPVTGVILADHAGDGLGVVTEAAPWVTDRGEIAEDDKDPGKGMHPFAIGGIVILMGALATPDVERTKVAPAEKLNRQRAKRGRSPIGEFTLIDLRPKPDEIESRGEPTSGRASPRPHWRRGHLRAIGEGRRVPIPPTRVRMDKGVPIPARYLVKT
jgi:hypothetical protein